MRTYFHYSRAILMDKALFYPQKVFVTKDCENLPITKKILNNTCHLPQEFITDSRELIDDILLSRNPVGEGKKLLLVTQQKGGYVKPCPCTPKYIGCNYFIINADLNCPLDCTYCILQLYLSNPLITIHADTSELYRQLDDFLHKNRNRTFRIGTGELGDSLALDHLTDRSSELISYFAGHPNAIFELKTKTVNIKNILAHEPQDNVVISWSLNSARMAIEEEIGAPSVHDRLQAARLVSQAGYRVGFHFDPIIHYEGWADGYRDIIEDLMDQIDTEKIAWISLGSLRFPPALKPVIQKRFPRTKIIYDEFIIGKDGKLRYPKPLRLWLYQRIVDDLKKAGGGEIPLYFCMESTDIWLDVQKKAPRSKKEVEKLLTLPLGANEV
jgi:spore photoproduct lyase